MLGGSAHVVELTVQNFQEVIGRSRELPVALLCWTDQVPVSATMRRTLESLAEHYAGRLLVATVDVATEGRIAQQLKVQSVPDLKVIRDGQLVEDVAGAQGERVLRELLDRHTRSGAERIRDELAELVANGRERDAIEALHSALAEEPGNPAFLVELADLLARTGDLDGAEATLSDIPESATDRARPLQRIAIMREVLSGPDEMTVRESLQANPQDPEAMHRHVLQLAAAGEIEAGVDAALAMLARHRSWADGQVQRTLLRLFDLMGQGSELASRSRRRMFAMLH